MAVPQSFGLWRRDIAALVFLTDARTYLHFHDSLNHSKDT